MAIKKAPIPQPAGRIHKDKELPDNLLKFSFRHWYLTDKFCIPPIREKEHYLETMLRRLKDMSNLTVNEFRTSKDKSIRAHLHDWVETTEPNGYANLNSQLQQCEPWQFCLSANEYGRIHGILIDDVFYVVWLDHNHALYNKA